MASAEHQDKALNAESISLHKVAGAILNKVATEIVEHCKAGTRVSYLCVYGDRRISEELSEALKEKKKLHRGRTVPTSVSVNERFNFSSPTMGDKMDVTLKSGDAVHIYLHAHVHYNFEYVGCTHVVDASAENPVTGRQADVMAAAYWTFVAIARLVKPGVESLKLMDVVQKLSQVFHCTPLEDSSIGIMAPEYHVGDKTSLVASTARDIDHWQFKCNEVHNVVIGFSTGDGKYSDDKTSENMYKIALEGPVPNNALRNRFLREVRKRVGYHVFSLRDLSDVRGAKDSIDKCVDEGLIQKIAPRLVPGGDCVAEICNKFLVTHDGCEFITCPPFNPSCFTSSYTVDDPELKFLLGIGEIKSEPKKSQKKKETEAKETA